jgi:hypothetical protein
LRTGEIFDIGRKVDPAKTRRKVTLFTEEMMGKAGCWTACGYISGNAAQRVNEHANK